MPRCFLPLKIFLMSRFEFDLQTISGFLLCPPWPGTEPLFGSGKNAWRSGWARAVPARSANAPRTASQRPYPPHPNGNVHHSASTRVTCRAAPARPDPAGSPAPARERFRRAARPAPALQVRAGDHPARAEHDLDRRRQDPAPEGLRLDRRLPPQPAAPRRLGPARRRDPPPPRGVADQRAADVRGRRGEDAREAAARLRLALLAGRQVAPQPHDPQPAAEPGQGLHHVRHRLHPRLVAGREEDPQGQDAVARRRGRQGLPGVRRPPRQRSQRALHLPRRRSPARTAAGPRATRRSSRATACWSGRPGTSTRAASTPTSSSRAAGARSTCSARRRTTGSRPARCRGTWR